MVTSLYLLLFLQGMCVLDLDVLDQFTGLVHVVYIEILLGLGLGYVVFEIRLDVRQLSGVLHQLVVLLLQG